MLRSMHWHASLTTLPSIKSIYRTMTWPCQLSVLLDTSIARDGRFSQLQNQADISWLSTAPGRDCTIGLGNANNQQAIIEITTSEGIKLFSSPLHPSNFVFALLPAQENLQQVALSLSIPATEASPVDSTFVCICSFHSQGHAQSFAAALHRIISQKNIDAIAKPRTTPTNEEAIKVLTQAVASNPQEYGFELFGHDEFLQEMDHINKLLQE